MTTLDTSATEITLPPSTSKARTKRDTASGISPTASSSADASSADDPPQTTDAPLATAALSSIASLTADLAAMTGQPTIAPTDHLGALARPLQAIGAASTTPAFLTEPGSPFPDGYSIRLEREALADLLARDNPDEGDPRYERLLMLDDRERQLRAMKADYKRRDGADAVVPGPEAGALRQLGGLVDEDDDIMTIHTKEAYRLFMGRARDPAGELQPIIGGKRVASALRGLWTLTGFDNPYADWALCLHQRDARETMQRIKDATTSAETALSSARQRGLSYGVVRSSAPKDLTLGFRSPYGYAIAELVVAYDYFIRIQKTLARKNLLTDDAVRQAIRDLNRVIRARFNQTARFERWLLRPEMASLSRADFVPGADTDAVKRVEAATGIFGPVPAEVYSGRIAPTHSKRRGLQTPQDRQLLREVTANLAAAEATTASRGRGDDEHEATELL